VPFSAIYFPTYFHLKKDLFGEGPNKKLGVASLLISGAIAGMPAAYLTTPMDVVKTRLQVEARKGEQTYTSLRHCARTILAQEGWRAFFKGGPARVLRSSPQFGFTLAGYEYLSRLFPLHHEDASTPETGGKYLAPGEAASAAATSSPLPYVRSRNALKILLDLDTKFGMPKQDGGSRWVANYSFLNGSGNGHGAAPGAGLETAAAPSGAAAATVSTGREGFIGTRWYQKFGDVWWGAKKDN
jgi:solute carrier family 25 aspartate/glutamate transporter 12/13